MTTPDLTGKTVCVLDTYGIVYQVFHSLVGMSSPRGEPTGATFGFVRDVMTILTRLEADYVFCAFDMHGATFRHGLYPQYKANRPPMPEDLRAQIGFIRDFNGPLGIRSLGLVGYEADDLLATIARRTREAGGRAVLVTGDKDARQLIDDFVSLYSLRHQKYYRTKELFDDWGIRPDQVVDFQTLVGDSTDNVPGVPLIGPKSATELLTKYQTLEGVFEHLDELKGKKKEHLAASREQTTLTRQLVRLKDDVPIEIDWDASLFKGVDAESLRVMFRYFGFRSLVAKIDELAGRLGDIGGGHLPEYVLREATFVPSARTGPEPNVGKGSTGEDALFALLDKDDAAENRAIMPVAPMVNMLDTVAAELPDEIKLPEKPRWNLVDTEELFDAFMERLSDRKIFSVDLETTSVNAREAKIVGLAFSFDTTDGWYIPVKSPLGCNRLDLDMVLRRLRPILESSKIGKVGQNIKYDTIVFRAAGVALRGIVFDTMVANYLLRTGQRNHNLDDMAKFYFDYTTKKIGELIGTGKNQKRMDEVHTDIVSAYAGEDALVAWALFLVLLRELKNVPSLFRLMTELEMPLVEVLADLEYQGVRIDRDVFAKLDREFQKRIEVVETQIRDLVRDIAPDASFADTFNLNSHQQLERLLFDDLKLPVRRKTKTGRSTDIDVLEELAAYHPLPALMIRHRQLVKLLTTCIVPYPRLCNSETNRIHASFNQVVTATGRLSSSDPNLQNIPVRSDEGRLIRTGFVPDAACGFDTIVSCDYSQIELRVLAHVSQDEGMIAAFVADEDIHTRVASEIFDVPASLVTSEMRRKAKAVNFGLIYGQTAFGLSKELSITREEASEYIRSFFETYPGIQTFFDRTLAECREKGYARTILGRRRKIDGIREVRPSGQMNEAERTAINTVIQGTAADLMKLAMVRVFRRMYGPSPIAPEKAVMLLQIHDELVFETKADFVPELSKMVVEEMRFGQLLAVPLKIDVESGPNRGDMKHIGSP